MKLEKDEYQCFCCSGVFKRELTDEEVRAQFEEEFPGMPFDESCELVCDDCYRRELGYGDEESETESQNEQAGTGT